MTKTSDKWQKLFALNCDSMDDFLLFYSSVHSAMTRIKEYQSVALKDEAFRYAYLSKSLDIKELHAVTKQLMTNTKDNYMTVLPNS